MVMTKWQHTCLDEDLHTTAKAEDEMQGRFLLDVVVGQGAAVLKLLACEDQALLVWGNALLVLDLGLDIVDGV
jgi:streptomycin 6-kinase